VGGWFDSHCHVQEEYVSGPASGDPVEAGGPAGAAEVEAVLARAAGAGVDRLICIGTAAGTSEQALGLAREAARHGADPMAWATVGLHPHDASQGVDEIAALLERAVREEAAVVAVGECGLDYYYEHSPRDTQRAVFAAQVALALERDLALVVHTRDAWADTLGVLDDVGVPARTVIHCFSGGPDEARACLERGAVLSFSGIVTFKNAADVREAARLCPLERLLVEIDAPFLAPVPHRGHPNEPAWVVLVGAAVAAARDEPAAAVEAATWANTERLFGLG